MARRLVIGVDLGGTKVAAGIADTDANLLHSLEEPTDTSSADSCLDQVVRIVRDLAEKHSSGGELVGIGVGVPGITESATGLVVWAPNLPGWRNIPLGEKLRKEFGVPALVENDVDVAALGEWQHGAGRGSRNMILIAIGTGIGCGMILDGKLYKGSGGVAGAIGWSVISEDRLFQEEYKAVGCVETLAAGPGIGRRAQEAARENPSCRLVGLANGRTEEITSRTVFDAAKAGDEAALKVIGDTAEFLGILVANAISMLNPEIVALGGGVAEGGDLLLKPLAEIALAHAQPIAASQVRIVPAVLGNRAGLIGALCLAGLGAPTG